MRLDLRPSASLERQAVETLLHEAGLPTGDLTEAVWEQMIVATANDQVVGAIALESSGSVAMLRSLVVHSMHRNAGIAKTLVAAAERVARERAIRSIYLLTESVQGLFSKLGYRSVHRDDAPDTIRQHPQFRSLCPASATFMRKRLPAALLPYHVLFLCTGNSARSILGEALLNHLGDGRFIASSAGSHPTGNVNPLAIEVLQSHGVDSGQPRSKRWEEFAEASARPIDIVLTVCDSAASEVCPVWPGHPLTAHWGVHDPASVIGSHETRLQAFESVFGALEFRVQQLLDLPIDDLEPHALRERLAAIGKQSKPEILEDCRRGVVVSVEAEGK